ncbi:MAG: hypothetical protein HFG80_00345 [Eubacterium sp.]|jgi:hypothetical protein|nr:hypothetical protein [Eubacterium sp.]
MTGTKRRTRKFKFTEKKQSVKGLLSIVFDIAAIVLILDTVMKSVAAKGEANLYIGSRGVLALIIAIAGLTLGIAGIREKDVFMAVPKSGTIAGIIVTAVIVCVYVFGIFL